VCDKTPRNNVLILEPVTTSFPAHGDVATWKEHSRDFSKLRELFFVTPFPLQAVRIRFVDVESERNEGVAF
jgi:hypothetical protein